MKICQLKLTVCALQENAHNAMAERISAMRRNTEVTRLLTGRLRTCLDKKLAERQNKRRAGT